MSSGYPVDAVRVRRFPPRDRAAACELVLTGFEKHWGCRDPQMNPDLDDIASAHAGARFIVGEDGTSPRLVGTGVLVRESENVARIVRNVRHR